MILRSYWIKRISDFSSKKEICSSVKVQDITKRNIESKMPDFVGLQTARAYEEKERLIAKSLRLKFDLRAFESGKGVYFRDPDGIEYLDFGASGCVANTGYCHPKIVEAIVKQAQKLTCSAFCSVTNKINLELAEKLIRITPGSFRKKVWYGCTGSDANDLIYRIVPDYKMRGFIITFSGSYHGSTMGSYSLSGFRFSSQSLRTCPGVIMAPYAYCYRCPLELEYPQCNISCAAYLEEQILNKTVSAEDVACIHLEAIEGDGGIIVPPDEWVHRVRDICKRNDILFTVDEVKSGCGRTGKWFAIDCFNDSGIAPDLITIGKPLASGLPLSAVVGNPEILDFAAGGNLYTLGGAPIAVAAANATINVIESENLLSNSDLMGVVIRGFFSKLKDRFEIIGDVRGRGLYSGIELVKDQRTKEPATNESRKVVFRSWQLGLYVPCLGTYSNVLVLTPPLVITKREVEKGLEILEQALRDVSEGRVSDDCLKYFHE